MEVIIRPDAQAAAQLTAQLIAKRLQDNPRLVLGLATGRTMERVYQNLVQLHRAQGLDFSLCRSFNLDEYIGLAADDPRSYHQTMQQQLFRHINIDSRNAHLLDGMAEDLAAEAAHYEAMIAAAGGIDVQLLGIGEAGHIGFNEPLSALMSRTREKALSPVTRQQNADFFGGAAQVPTRALTMGVGTILEAREIIMLVTGQSKAAILAQAVEGAISARISATALQLHPNCKVIADEDASSALQGQEYYRWIFANEPEWQAFHDA